MARTKIVTDSINEGQDQEFKFKVTEDTTGKTLYFLYRGVDATGSAFTAGTVSGDVANTRFSMELDLSDVAPGEYLFWVYSDYGGTDQKLLIPNNDEVTKFEVIERE